MSGFLENWRVKRKLLSTRVAEKPRFSEPVREMLCDTLRPDAEAFLAHYGKPRDFWSLK